MKCAIVTGASRGIGKAIAIGLAKDGFQIVVNYLNNERKALETVAECEVYGVKAIAVQANVSDYEACRQLVSKAKETFGSIDVLVNNAGITKDNDQCVSHDVFRYTDYAQTEKRENYQYFIRCRYLRK